MKAFSLIVLGSLCLTLPALAALGGWGVSDHLRIRLLSYVSSISDTEHFQAGLEMELSEGWHTYWRVSGDSGLPPQFDWNGSENVEHVDVLWPAPTRKNEQGFFTFGYDERVILPLDVTVKERNMPVTLALSAQIMVCKDICIPQQLKASLTIPKGGGESAPMAVVIERALQDIPVLGNTDTLKIESIDASVDALTLDVFSENGFAENMDVFPVSETLALTLPPEIKSHPDDPQKATIRIPATPDIENLEAALQGMELSITLVNGDEAIERRVNF